MPIRNSSWFGHFALHVAILSSLMAVTMSIVYCGCRLGFTTNYAGILRVTGLALLILNVAPLGRLRWFTHPTALVLYTIAGVTAASWFLKEFGFVGWLWTGAGYLLFGWNLLTWLSGIRRSRWGMLLLLLAALACGLYVSGKTWGLGYNNPLAEERLLVNQGHIDALFHSSISNMIRTYGRPSTGLDGVPYIAYHYGSHWVVAALAPVCGQSVFEFYNSGTGIIFIPLMFAGLLLLAGVIRDAVRDDGTPDYGLPAGFLFWGVIVAGMLGPFPKKGDMMRVSLMEIYDSDSYALGLAISFLVIAIAVLFCREWNRAGRPSDVAASLALLIAFPSLYCVCALLKVSLAYLLFGMGLYLCIRLDLWRDHLIQLHLLISIVALAGLTRFIISRGDARLAFFTFDRIHPEWIPYFLIFYFVWVWIFLLLRTRQLHLNTIDDARRAFLQKDTLSAELLVFCTTIGLLPYFALRFETGSWNYFTQYQTFLGMALTAGYLPSWPRSLWSLTTQKLKELPIYAGFVGALVSLFCLHLAITTFGSVYGLLKLNAEIRTELTGHPPDEWGGMVRSLYGASRGSISPELRDRQEMLSCLRSLGEMPLAQKRTSVLYIPKSNRTYWGNLRQQNPNEGAVSFIAPALTGIAMIDGEPEYDDLSATRRLDYGFWAYPLPTRIESPTSIGAGEATARAEALGFVQIITVQDGFQTHCAIQISHS